MYGLKCFSTAPFIAMIPKTGVCPTSLCDLPIVSPLLVLKSCGLSIVPVLGSNQCSCPLTSEHFTHIPDTSCFDCTTILVSNHCCRINAGLGMYLDPAHQHLVCTVHRCTPPKLEAPDTCLFLWLILATIYFVSLC